MIVKHFNRHKWILPNDWDNVDHKYGGPDPDKEVELNERQIAENAVISDDEVGEGSEVEDADITQRRLRYNQRGGTPLPRATRRRARPSDLEIDELSPEKSQTLPSQRRRR
jgi:hypothetical protein